jgi:hypothetical protein
MFPIKKFGATTGLTPYTTSPFISPVFILALGFSDDLELTSSSNLLKFLKGEILSESNSEFL